MKATSEVIGFHHRRTFRRDLLLTDCEACAPRPSGFLWSLKRRWKPGIKRWKPWSGGGQHKTRQDWDVMAELSFFNFLENCNKKPSSPMWWLLSMVSIDLHAMGKIQCACHFVMWKAFLRSKKKTPRPSWGIGSLMQMYWTRLTRILETKFKICKIP